MSSARGPLGTRWAIVGVLVLGLARGTGGAEPFPTRPLELVVPTPPGGGLDIATRLLAEATEPFLGQKVVIINKPGAGGTVALSALTQAKPDGYTLVAIWNAPLTITPHVRPVPYTLDDLTLISLFGETPLLFCTRPDFPAADAKQFIDVLHKNPGKFTYGTEAVAGLIQVAAERIFQAQGVRQRAVPFGGTGETVKAFLGGHVDLFVGTLSVIQPHVKAGKAKCLLLTSRDRMAAVPEAAGLADLGTPQATTVLWRGIIGPRGLPADRVALLEKAFRQGALAPKYRDFTQRQGETPVGSSAAEFRELVGPNIRCSVRS